MCGISGYLNLDKKPTNHFVLEKMAKIMSHRGPDDFGIFQDKEVGLSHTRLSIIDLSANGKQPMETDDARYIISYNGIIFNFQELRLDLEKKGWKFKSHSDTEVILKAVVEWGPKIISKFNGQFAFAIWDKKERSLLLARDRYGIKPLYVFRDHNKLIFGSEIKALMCHPDLTSSINKKGLFEYLTFQNFLSEQTLFKNVNIVPAGTYLKINSDNKITEHRYWDFNFNDPKDKNPVFQEYKDECEFLLNKAIKRQLVSDVEIGCYLSGGMDSGVITSIASKYLKYLRSFTCGFDVSSSSHKFPGGSIEFSVKLIVSLISEIESSVGSIENVAVSPLTVTSAIVA